MTRSQNPTNSKKLFAITVLIFVLAFIGNMSLGSVPISLSTTFKTLLGLESKSETVSYIIHAYRLPKAITGVCVGAGLSLSGLLMQTLFKNPLAGPYVLGISSGASLGAALFILGTSGLGVFSLGVFGHSLSTTLAASLGSFFVLFVVMSVSKYVKNTMSLLIIGLMFGSLSGAIVSILAFFSTKESLQKFIFWSYGNLGNLSNPELGVLGGFVATGTLVSLVLVKWLNALLLGDEYAQSLGVPLHKLRLLIVIATGLMAGSITAFAGPIAFLGLAVPHICRLIWNTNNHKTLIPASLLLGAVFMLVSDGIAQLPGSAKVLPINAVTAIFGAPIVIWLLMRKKQIQL